MDQLKRIRQIILNVGLSLCAGCQTVPMASHIPVQDTKSFPDSRSNKQLNGVDSGDGKPIELTSNQQSSSSTQLFPPAPVKLKKKAIGTPLLLADNFTQSNALSLDEVIRIALDSNPDLQSATERIWIADASLDRARAEFLPTLGLSENYGVSNNPINTFSFQLNQAQLSFNQDFNNPRTIDNFETRLRAQYGIYAGGRRTADKNASQWNLNGAHNELSALQNQLIFRVAQAYYLLLKAERLQQVREEAVQQVEQHLKIVSVRIRAETAVKSDGLSVEIRLAEAREAFITSRHRVELAWALLENVCGQQIDRQPIPREVPTGPWLENAEDLESAIAEALSRRPEIDRMANRQEAALWAVEAAKSGNQPTVGFVSDYNINTPDFTDGNDSFFVGLVVELNLLDGGRTRSEIRKAAAQVREIAARRQRLALDIELDVRRAYILVKDAKERLSVVTKAVEQARESLREIEVRYRAQTATITQLIDAQVAISDARVRRTSANGDLQIARANLARAIGRLKDSIVQ